MAAARLARPGDGRSRLDQIEPARDVRIGGQRSFIARQHEPGAVDPAPRRDVNDGVFTADDVGAAFMISDVMDGADVGVVQRRGRTGFAPETAQGIRTSPAESTF